MRRTQARPVADELLTEKRSEGTLHLAPALSPDGSQVGVLQREGLLLRRHVPGRRRHRQGQAPDPQAGHQQQLRDLPLHQQPGRTGRRDGKFLAVAAKRGPRDEIIIVHVRCATRPSKRIKVKLSGITTPSLEPGRQAARLHRVRGRVQRPVHGEPRRERAPSAHRGQVRRPAPRLVARRQVPSRSPPTAGRAPTSGCSRVGNFRIALYDLATGADAGARPYGSGQEREPAVGA